MSCCVKQCCQCERWRQRRAGEDDVVKSQWEAQGQLCQFTAVGPIGVQVTDHRRSPAHGDDGCQWGGGDSELESSRGPGPMKSNPRNGRQEPRTALIRLIPPAEWIRSMVTDSVDPGSGKNIDYWPQPQARDEEIAGAKACSRAG